MSPAAAAGSAQPADPHSAPVPESAWRADEVARARGRVEIFNATRPGGLDGWTMDLQQYELVRAHILDVVARPTRPDGTVLLKDLVASTQDRFGDHPAFPGGRLRNYCTYTKVDLEARGSIERVPGSSPQRIRLRPTDAGPHDAGLADAGPADARPADGGAADGG